MEIYSIDIKEDKDIIAARDRARVICEELGFAITQQLQVTTSVFELGKNILEHANGGSITFSILTDGDNLSLEVVGEDQGPGLSEEQVEDLLQARGGSTAANRGIPAMKRLMDLLEIESEAGRGTVIRMVKRKPALQKNLASNIVSFFQQKFSGRENPTLSQELRVQNANLVQSLSLYEEKNEELAQANKELLKVKQQLEESNRELQERSAELQDALLSLGDRTTELEAQNRRITAVLQQMSEGVAITDRSGTVTTANKQFCSIVATPLDQLAGKTKREWYDFLGRFQDSTEDSWSKTTIAMENEPKKIHTFDLKPASAGAKEINCRVFPILDGDEKFIGRLWIAE